MTLAFASEAARIAATLPEVTAVLALWEETEAALLAQDADGFGRHMAPELMVNSPANRVLPMAMAVGAMRAGLIDYSTHHRILEHAEVRANGEVLLMGAEVLTPQGRTHHAGNTVTYRVTEIWRKAGDGWLLSVRHATVSEVV